jgi:TRAP-type uncharacterized transport system fused permease subunit
LKNGFYLSFRSYCWSIFWLSPVVADQIGLLVYHCADGGVHDQKGDAALTPRKLFKTFEAGLWRHWMWLSFVRWPVFMMGLLSVTGLGLKFSNLLLTLSGGNMLILMLLTMVAALILGWV